MSEQSRHTDSGFRPLNPSDQVLLAIDQEIRRDGNHGSHCGFALELQGDLDMDALQHSITELQADFPSLSSRLEQRGKIFGWKTIDDPIPFHHHPCPEQTGSIADFQHNTLLSILNSGSTIDQSAPLQFHLIVGESSRLLLLHWFHPLLDARGVKLILDYLISGNRQRYTARDFSLIEQRFNRWSLWEKLKMAWNGKQYNDQIDRLNSDLPTPGSTGKQQLQCINHRFDSEETIAIQQLAKQTVGMGYQSIYYIGCLMRALHSVGMAVKNDAICVPYAFNLRQSNAPVPVLGNHVSVLFSQAPHAIIEDRHQLFKHLSKQYAQTIRKGQDYSFIPWMWIGRWMSLEKYGTVLRQQRGGGERGSVWFSDIGELRFPSDTLFGATISGVRHLCILTSPPSFAVLFGQFQGQLNIAYNYLQPDIDSDWVYSVNRKLQQELLNNSDLLQS